MAKIEIRKNRNSQKSKFAKIENGKNRNWQKSKFSKIEIDKNRNWQKSKYTKIRILIKNRNFGEKLELSAKNRNSFKKSNSNL